MGYVLVTPPAAEALSQVEAKAHMRVDWTDDDATIDAIVAAARQHIEGEMNRVLVTQTWRATFGHFPRFLGPIRLAKGPVSAVSSVKYYDDQDVLQTLAAELYQVDLSNEVAEIWPAPGECWPSTFMRWLGRARRDAVTVEFIAGYGAPAAVPELFKQAIRLLAGDWFANRELTVTGITSPTPIAVQRIIDNNKLQLLA